MLHKYIFARTRLRLIPTAQITIGRGLIGQTDVLPGGVVRRNINRVTDGGIAGRQPLPANQGLTGGQIVLPHRQGLAAVIRHGGHIAPHKVEQRRARQTAITAHPAGAELIPILGPDHQVLTGRQGDHRRIGIIAATRVDLDGAAQHTAA